MKTKEIKVKYETLALKVQALSDEGITPLDLFGWTYLLDIHARYKTFTGIDLDIHHRMQGDLAKALWKKAEMRDEYDKTTFRHDLLKEMGVPRPINT